ncbi:hypothetical protein HYS99_01210 [Candidatus Giovannonibacteria bacterium]|nr:hypothetical protein [Candidatus Giovannonibacteria bacterium]
MPQYLNVLKNPSWDIALFLAFSAIIFFWGMSRGKNKIGISILALYVMNVVFPYIPLGFLISGRSILEIFIIKSILFTVLLLLIALLLIRSFKNGSAGSTGNWWQILILCILIAGFFMASVLRLADPVLISKNIIGLSPVAIKWFFTERIIWFILPILGVMFI